MRVDGSENRREFSKRILGTAVSVLFLDTLFACSNGQGNEISSTNRVIQPKAAFELKDWVTQLHRYCADLRTNRLTAAEWQHELDRLFNRIELSDLLSLIDFERLSSNRQLPDLGVSTKGVRLPSITEIPEDRAFVRKIFGMRKGRAIIPHGHSNMASGHMVLKGSFHLRQYDKISVNKKEIEFTQTVSEQVGRGRFSSISDEKNNIHWFIAEEGPAYTFDVIMLDLGGKKYDIHNIDIDRARKTSNARLKAPLLPVEKALRKYGRV